MLDAKELLYREKQIPATNEPLSIQETLKKHPNKIHVIIFKARPCIILKLGRFFGLGVSISWNLQFFQKMWSELNVQAMP
jgi:hypothetical protein